MKYLVLFASCLILAGCNFLTYEQVQSRVKACTDVGGKNTIHLNRDSKALKVTCTVDGVVYFVTDKGNLI